MVARNITMEGFPEPRVSFAELAEVGEKLLNRARVIAHDSEERLRALTTDEPCSSTHHDSN